MYRFKIFVYKRKHLNSYIEIIFNNKSYTSLGIRYSNKLIFNQYDDIRTSYAINNYSKIHEKDKFIRLIIFMLEMVEIV